MATALASRIRTKHRDELDAKAAILNAALQEFGDEGFAGARVESIARAAKVNISLLFYYFKSKQELHGAVLEQIFSQWNSVVQHALAKPGTPRQKLLAYVGDYFDFVAANPLPLRLVQQEMMRKGRSGSPHIRSLAQNYIQPVHRKLIEAIEAGMGAGDFNQVDPRHFIYSITGIINFYFANSPVVAVLSGQDPWSGKNIRARRKEVLRVIQLALFA